jgi:hypothetical protein
VIEAILGSPGLTHNTFSGSLPSSVGLPPGGSAACLSARHVVLGADVYRQDGTKCCTLAVLHMCGTAN